MEKAYFSYIYKGVAIWVHVFGSFFGVLQCSIVGRALKLGVVLVRHELCVKNGRDRRKTDWLGASFS
jgi:hypothetical protein